MSEDTPAPKPFERVAWPVRTARLSIRPVTPEDFRRLYEIRAIPEVTQWLTGRPTSYEDYVERYGTPARLDSTLVVELDGTIIGDLFLGVEAPYSQVEVRDRAEGSQAAMGWLLDPAYVGHGYATEAAAEVLRICFEELWAELAEKAEHRPDGSGTVAELDAGVHAIGKKIVEEAAEVWMAAEYQSDEETAEEISQLVYHLQVLMVAKGLTPADVWRHL